MEGSELKKRLKDKGISLSSLAEKLGISPQALNSRLNSKDLTLSTLNEIQNACGYILTDDQSLYIHTDLGLASYVCEPPIIYGSTDTRPRIPTKVAAGTLSSFAEAVKSYDCERVPVVKAFPAYDFTILVKGDSMSPRFESGDEIAIRKTTDYIEWGKPHVLDTRDGAVLKRLYDEGEFFRCVSYNDEYPPFTINKNDVFGVYKIVGLLRI